MIKIKYLFPILFFFLSSLSAQSIDIPKLSLTGIPFEISISKIPDSIKTVEVFLLGGKLSYAYKWEVVDGKISKQILIDASNNYEIKNSLFPNESMFIQVIPGWLSLVPPLIAIFLALLIRQVVVSLSIGIFSGALIYMHIRKFP